MSEQPNPPTEAPSEQPTAQVPPQAPTPEPIPAPAPKPKPPAATNQLNGPRAALLFMGVGALLLVFFSSSFLRNGCVSSDRRSPVKNLTRSGSTPQAGDTAYLDGQGEGAVLVAVNEKVDDELNKYAGAKNTEAVKLLVEQGLVMKCSTGTRVSVVSTSFMSATIRIMSGEHAGKTGVIPKEFIYK